MPRSIWGKKEQPYLDHSLHRMVKAGRKIYNCVTFRPGLELLNDGLALYLDGISVLCILVPGHTAGHMCYIVDGRVLFSGDCLIEQDLLRWDLLKQQDIRFFMTGVSF